MDVHLYINCRLCTMLPALFFCFDSKNVSEDYLRGYGRSGKQSLVIVSFCRSERNVKCLGKSCTQRSAKHLAESRIAVSKERGRCWMSESMMEDEREVEISEVSREVREGHPSHFV